MTSHVLTNINCSFRQYWKSGLIKAELHLYLFQLFVGKKKIQTNFEKYFSVRTKKLHKIEYKSLILQVVQIGQFGKNVCNKNGWFLSKGKEKDTIEKEFILFFEQKPRYRYIGNIVLCYDTGSTVFGVGNNSVFMANHRPLCKTRFRKLTSPLRQKSGWMTKVMKVLRI